MANAERMYCAKYSALSPWRNEKTRCINYVMVLREVSLEHADNRQLLGLSRKTVIRFITSDPSNIVERLVATSATIFNFDSPRAYHNRSGSCKPRERREMLRSALRKLGVERACPLVRALAGLRSSAGVMATAWVLEAEFRSTRMRGRRSG